MWQTIWQFVCQLVCLPVCLQSVLWQNGWVDPDAIGIVSGVGRGMGVLAGGRNRWREKAVLGVNLGCSIVTNGNFATRLFTNYFGQDLFFGQPYYRLCLRHTVSSVCRSSVTFCIVAKWYVLAKNCLKERIGNRVKKLTFWVTAIFLFPVSPLRPSRRPLLHYFCPYSQWSILDGTHGLSCSKPCAYCRIVRSELKPGVVLATIIDPERCK